MYLYFYKKRMLVLNFFYLQILWLLYLRTNPIPLTHLSVFNIPYLYK